jgi:hypothetical protein
MKSIGNHIVNECIEWSRCIRKGDMKYKVHQKRLNFLYKSHSRVGRDHLVSDGEISRGRLNPITI